MELDSLRQLRRALSAAVAVSGVALVMVKMQAPATPGPHAPGVLSSLLLLGSLVAFVLVWRQEHAKNQAAAAERERAQLLLIRVQAELLNKKQEQQQATEHGAAGARRGS